MSITAPKYPLPQNLGLDQYTVDHKSDILKIIDKLRKRGYLSPPQGSIEPDIPILEYLAEKGLVEKYEIGITREHEPEKIILCYRVKDKEGLDEFCQKLSSLG